MVLRRGTKLSRALRKEGMHNSDWSKLRNIVRRTEKDPLHVDTPHSRQAGELVRDFTRYSARGIKAKVPALAEEMRKNMGRPMKFTSVTPTQALKDRARARLDALRAQQKPKLPPHAKSGIQKLAGPRKRLP